MVNKSKIFAASKGFFGRKKNCWTIAVRTVHRAWQFAYIGRKQRKRLFRTNWIQQINAGARQHGMGYSALMRALPLTGVGLNRKVLAELAGTEPYTFKAVIEAARRQEREMEPRGGAQAEAGARERRGGELR